MLTVNRRYHQSSVLPHFLILKQLGGLCRNPGNFSQGKQTYSAANTPSIINSPLLSFPWGNHSTQQTETQPAAWDLLPLPCGKDHNFTKTLTYLWQWEQVDLFDSMNPRKGITQIITPGWWMHERLGGRGLSTCCTFFSPFLWIELKRWGLLSVDTFVLWRPASAVADLTEFTVDQVLFVLTSPWIWRRGWNYCGTLARCPQNLHPRCWWCL